MWSSRTLERALFKVFCRRPFRILSLPSSPTVTMISKHSIHTMLLFLLSSLIHHLIMRWMSITERASTSPTAATHNMTTATFHHGGTLPPRIIEPHQVHWSPASVRMKSVRSPPRHLPHFHLTDTRHRTGVLLFPSLPKQVQQQRLWASLSSRLRAKSNEKGHLAQVQHTKVTACGDPSLQHKCPQVQLQRLLCVEGC